MNTVKKGYIKDVHDPELLTHHAKSIALLKQVENERKQALIKFITEMDNEKTLEIMEKVVDANNSLLEDIQKTIEFFPEKCWRCYEQGFNYGCPECKF